MKNDKLTPLPQGYDDLLKDLKARVHKARMNGALSCELRGIAHSGMEKTNTEAL